MSCKLTSRVYNGKRDFTADKLRDYRSCRITQGKKVKRRRWVDEAAEVVRGQILKDLGLKDYVYNAKDFGGFHSIGCMGPLKDFKQR